MYSQKKYKKLAIISDCIHAFTTDGTACTEVHIFCKQMQELSKHFEQTVVVCPFTEHNADKAYSLYYTGNISFIPTPAAGGNSVAHKLKLLATIPAWLKAFYKAGKISDVIYLRFPNNISIPAWFYYTIIRKKRFITYTGNWEKYPGEPFSYRTQRWIIKHLHNDPAFVYTKRKNTRANIYKSFSPSYSFHEWEKEEGFVCEKIKTLENEKKFLPVFLSIARLSEIKNHIYILKAFKLLHDKNFHFHLYVFGNGSEETKLRKFIIENNLQDCIFLKGALLHHELKPYFRKSHFIVQAPLVEGYGKVPIEGFFHGCIPLLSNVGVSEEITGYGKRGFVFSTNNTLQLVQLIEYVTSNYHSLKDIILAGRIYAKDKTLENWANQLASSLNSNYAD